VSAALYERDPTQYVAAFETYLQGWEGSDEERDLASWITFAAVGSDDPDIFRFVALGYVTATWESWADDVGDRRLGLFENMRRRSDRDCAERGIPAELYDLVYGINVISVQIPNFARPGDESLTDRLDLIWEQVVLGNTQFESTPTEETLLGLRNFYNKGIGLYLFLRWWQALDEQAIPHGERWSDIGLVPVYDDRLADFELPMTIRDCTLDETDTLGYEIRSPGKFGGQHLTAFLAEGDVANILRFVVSGRLGTRAVKMPQTSHIDLLRDLGFQEATSRTVSAIGSRAGVA
jgi:hypothetical protein